MEIVDKEQERLAKEQMPEGKKAKKLAIIGRIAFLVVMAIGIYFLDYWRGLSEEPCPISVENITVIPGETTVQELIQAGYGLSDTENKEWVMENYSGYFYYPEIVDPTAEADSKSYYYMVLVKDGLSYGKVVIYNDAEWQAKPVTECKVSALEVASYDEASNQAMILDIPLLEATEEAISERLQLEPEVSDSGQCMWKKGRYSVTLRPHEEGDGRTIRSEYKLN